MAEVPMGAVAVENLGAVLQALGEFDKGAARSMRGALAEVAAKAAQMAVFIAESKGLRNDAVAPSGGGLIDSIRGGFRGRYGYITATAKRESPAYPDGFNYPAIYEYGGSQTRKAHGEDYMIRNRSVTGTRLIARFGLGEGHVGPRAFLYPAAVEGEPILERELEAAIETTARAVGLEVRSL